MKPYLQPITILIAAATVGFLGAGVMFWQQKRKKKLLVKIEDMIIPSNWTRIGEVKEIIIYPLKGGKRMCLEEAEVTKFGIKDVASGLLDRQFIVFNERNEFMNMKRNSKIILVETTAVDKTRVKFFSFPDSNDCILNIPDKSHPLQQLNIYGSNTQAVDCGDEAAEWFSQRLLGQSSGLRLGCFVHEAVIPREVDEKTAKAYEKSHKDYMGIYSDIASYMLMSEESVNELNTRLETPVTEHNFRPNIVVQDSPAYSEDTWDWIRLGDLAVLRSFKYCTRCVMVTMDPLTGKSNPTVEPLRTLRKYRLVQEPHLRKVEGNSPVMGMYAGCHVTGFVRIGDTVFTA